MALKAIDTRGWNSVNHAPEVADGCSSTGGPFMAWKPEQLNSSLYEICSASATQLLIALKGEWYQAANIPNFIERRDGLLRSSREILSRFGPSAAFFTKASDAQDNPNAELLNPTPSGNASPSTPLTADLSLCPIQRWASSGPSGKTESNPTLCNYSFSHLSRLTHRVRPGTNHRAPAGRRGIHPGIAA
ncbi:hypothetical protein AB0L47_14685 [Streptomyces bobili]|uniref:hypothetical protein n=1 Tax=Streptomyces bobili TaxID=67280 RepID=UPI00344937C5